MRKNEFPVKTFGKPLSPEGRGWVRGECLEGRTA
jgi:hypothetical protein